MKKNTIIASVVATFVATAASAGTIVAPTPDPVIMPTPVFATSYWDGFYVGAAVGWSTGDMVIYPAAGDPSDGFGYGGFIGYNYVMDGGFMIGGEVAGSIFNFDPTSGATGVDGTMFDAKLRVGFEMDRALVYASGGYSMLSGDYLSTPATPIEGTGWNVGAGIDYLVTDSVFVGAEYVYRDITDSAATPAWESQSHAFTVRAGIKF